MRNSRTQPKSDDKVRILLLSNMYPSEKSPSYGIFVRNIYTQLDKAGVDITKCVLKGQSQTKLGKLMAYVVFVLKSVFRLMFTRRIIYIHFVAHTSFPVLILSFFRRFDIVAHVHGGDVMTQPQVSKKWTNIKSMMAKKILGLSEKIIVPSQYFSSFLQEEFRIDAESIFVSPSGGVDTRHFLPTEKDFKGIIKLGYVGRLDPGKGVDTLLRAVQLALKHGAHIELTIVGTGRNRDQLSQYVIDNGMQRECSFVGVQAQQELVGYYQAFDYFVFPSELNESLGLVGLEAMSCGIPVISTGRAGIGDYFENQINGFKYDSGDFVSLGEVISNLPSVESDVYRQMVKQCRLTALKFDSEIVKKKLINEFANFSPSGQ